MNPKLSIIIPVYNGKKYISRCLDSIFSLPLSAEELEVIVVDDCSTDGTLDILAQYQQAHTNLIVLRQAKNMRQGAARNRGIEIAKGEYIAFADADDEIATKGVMTAIEKAEQNSLDICYYTLCIKFKNGLDFDSCWNSDIYKIICGNDFLNNNFNYSLNGPTRGIFRRALLEDLRFVEGVRWEDGDFCLKLYAKAKRIGRVPEIGYYYYQNESSTSNTRSTDVVVDQVKLGLRLIDINQSTFHKDEPIYAKTQHEAVFRYIGMLRLKNLTLYTWRQNMIIHNDLAEYYKPININTKNTWIKLWTKCYCLASIILLIACPIARFIRKHIYHHTK